MAEKIFPPSSKIFKKVVSGWYGEVSIFRDFLHPIERIQNMRIIMRVQGQTFLLIEHIYKRAAFCVFIIFRSVMFRKQVVDGNRFRKDIAIQASF